MTVLLEYISKNYSDSSIRKLLIVLALYLMLIAIMGWSLWLAIPMYACSNLSDSH